MTQQEELLQDFKQMPEHKQFQILAEASEKLGEQAWKLDYNSFWQSLDQDFLSED